MFSLSVIRTQYNLRDGSKKTNKIFYMRHKYKYAISNMFNLLSNAKSFEGGDLIILKKDSKIIKAYLLCHLCGKNAVKQNTERCDKCTAKIAHIISKPPTLNIVKTFPDANIGDRKIHKCRTSFFNTTPINFLS